jgi:anaerobic selenocysteine-containing dehydrogenase
MHYQACPLCDAVCGLSIELSEGRVISIRGDKDDPFSRGHICPKAVALQDLQDDPDRLRQPVKREGERWVSISWDDALDLVAARLADEKIRGGGDSIAFYFGNPSIHSYGILTHAGHLLRLIETRNRYSTMSVDQLAHHVVSYHMYGHQSLLPVPDLDRTRFLLVLGANPVVSNGSLMTAPNVRRRLQAIRQRGGKLVVVDPRRTETAEMADAHYFIRPGTDALYLAAVLNVLFEQDLADPLHLRSVVSGFDELETLLQPFAPERVEAVTGVAAADIRRTAVEFAGADGAACYGRVGVSTHPFASACHWLIQLLNIATGNLDRTGGTLVPRPAIDLVELGLVSRGGPGRFHSRVRGLPSFAGELPAAVLAEEIMTPGKGQIRALVSVAGNPVLSTPNGQRLERALASLNFMASIDFYVNETTRFADVILPPTPPLERDHYDLTLFGVAVRNVTRFNRAALPKSENSYHDWEILGELAKRVAKSIGAPEPRMRTPERLINLALAHGPYGKRRRHPSRLDLKALDEAPHGIDLGALTPGLPKRLKTSDGKIHCIPAPLVSDLARVESQLRTNPPAGSLLLIGRRDARSNNSWMHNCERLIKGKDRCLLYINPQDAAERNLSGHEEVRVWSAAGEIVVPIKVTDVVMKGVVSLPHGWGHGRRGVKLRIAREHAGECINDLTNCEAIDPVSGAAAFNGVPVFVERSRFQERR